MARLPLSIQAIESSCCVNVPSKKKNAVYSSWIWVLTFFTYCSYHLSRKPISVVKNVLNQNCSELTPPTETNDSHWCDWKPFDGENSATLLGTIDSAFLFAYAFGMFISGIVAERIDLRYFLSVGMILSGAFCCMFGLGYTLSIHQLWFYVLAQVLSGICQTTGWPGVVAALGNWFGKSKRGLIFGIWNSHTSVGNILGTLIAAAFVTNNWAFSFIVPGMIIASVGVVVLFFLIPEPMMVGLPNPNLKKEVHLNDVRLKRSCRISLPVTLPYQSMIGLRTVQWSSNWPGNSPDLNPTGNLWALMKMKLCNRDTLSLCKLEETIHEMWAKMGPK